MKEWFGLWGFIWGAAIGGCVGIGISSHSERDDKISLDTQVAKQQVDTDDLRSRVSYLEKELDRIAPRQPGARP